MTYRIWTGFVLLFVLVFGSLGLVAYVIFFKDTTLVQSFLLLGLFVIFANLASRGVAWVTLLGVSRAE